MFDPELFRTDPVVMRMPLEAIGAYFMMICNLWLAHDPGIVEDNPIALARTARCDSDEWERVKDYVRPAFDTTSKPGFWIQKRVVKTYRKQTRSLRFYTSRAKKGALSRWKGSKVPVPQTDADKEDECFKHSSSIPQAMLGDAGSRFYVLGSKKLPLGIVDTVPDSKPLGNGANGKSVRLAAATQRGKLDPKTEAQAVKLDAAMVSANVGPETRAIVVAHYRSNAHTIANPLAYYRVGSQDFWQIAADLSAKAEIIHHRTEEPR